MDPISQLTNSLNTAAAARRPIVSVPYSAYKLAVLQALKRAQFLTEVRVRGEDTKRAIEAAFVLEDGTPRLREARRISKPSRRLYRTAQEVRPVRRGWGTLVLSTSDGVLTDAEARKKKVGGEPLFEVW